MIKQDTAHILIEFNLNSNAVVHGMASKLQPGAQRAGRRAAPGRTFTPHFHQDWRGRTLCLRWKEASRGILPISDSAHRVSSTQSQPVGVTKLCGRNSCSLQEHQSLSLHLATPRKALSFFFLFSFFQNKLRQVSRFPIL